MGLGMLRVIIFLGDERIMLMGGGGGGGGGGGLDTPARREVLYVTNEGERERARTV